MSYSLKDNSHINSEWTEVFRTVNAFLNTDGGILIIGIKEDEKNSKYIFTGFDFKNENKIKSIVTDSIFTEDSNIKKNVSEYIKYEIAPFQGGQILVIYVVSLPDDDYPSVNKEQTIQVLKMAMKTLTLEKVLNENFA